MLILFLRTFKYIFSYFSPFKNECACECVQYSFSARHFPSVVDEWLSTPHPSATAHHALHSLLPFDNSPSVQQLALSFNNLPFRSTTCPSVRQLALPFDAQLGVGRVPEGVPVQRKGLTMFARRELHSGEFFYRSTLSYLTGLHANDATSNWLMWYANGQSGRATSTPIFKQ